MYELDELVARDRLSLDIFCDNLPPPEVIAQEIVDDLEAALEQFRLIAADLGAPPGTGVPRRLNLSPMRCRLAPFRFRPRGPA